MEFSCPSTREYVRWLVIVQPGYKHFWCQILQIVKHSVHKLHFTKTYLVNSSVRDRWYQNQQPPWMPSLWQNGSSFCMAHAYWKLCPLKYPNYTQYPRNLMHLRSYLHADCEDCWHNLGSSSHSLHGPCNLQLQPAMSGLPEGVVLGEGKRIRIHGGGERKRIHGEGGWLVLRLLYVFCICWSVCLFVCVSALITKTCVIITTHTLLSCSFTLVDLGQLLEYWCSYWCRYCE